MHEILIDILMKLKDPKDCCHNEYENNKVRILAKEIEIVYHFLLIYILKF